MTGKEPEGNQDSDAPTGIDSSRGGRPQTSTQPPASRTSKSKTSSSRPPLLTRIGPVYKPNANAKGGNQDLMDLGIYEEKAEANDQDKQTAKKLKASEKMAEIYDNKKPGAATTSSHQKPKPSLNMYKQAQNMVPELRSKSSSHQ